MPLYLVKKLFFSLLTALGRLAGCSVGRWCCLWPAKGGVLCFAALQRAALERRTPASVGRNAPNLAAVAMAGFVLSFPSLCHILALVGAPLLTRSMKCNKRTYKYSTYLPSSPKRYLAASPIGGLESPEIVNVNAEKMLCSWENSGKRRDAGKELLAVIGLLVAC